jgi:hypothetical protein
MKKIYIFFCINIVLTGNALAYLDPGTGSIIIQGVIAAGLSAIFVIKTYWFKFSSFFKKKKNED